MTNFFRHLMAFLPRGDLTLFLINGPALLSRLLGTLLEWNRPTFLFIMALGNWHLGTVSLRNLNNQYIERKKKDYNI